MNALFKSYFCTVLTGIWATSCRGGACPCSSSWHGARHTWHWRFPPWCTLSGPRASLPALQVPVAALDGQQSDVFVRVVLRLLLHLGQDVSHDGARGGLLRHKGELRPWQPVVHVLLHLVVLWQAQQVTELYVHQVGGLNTGWGNGMWTCWQNTAGGVVSYCASPDVHLGKVEDQQVPEQLQQTLAKSGRFPGTHLKVKTMAQRPKQSAKNGDPEAAEVKKDFCTWVFSIFCTFLCWRKSKFYPFYQSQY